MTASPLRIPAATAVIPTSLFLARHGETVWHEENRYTGISDIGLTPRGIEQADGLGVWAAGAGLDAIVTSPLARARRTAEPAVRSTGLAAVVEPDLRELDFGVAEGRTIAELEASYPQEVADFRRDPVAHPLPGGENPKTAATRGATALLRLAETHQGRRVLTVAHNTLLRLVLCRLLGIPESEYRRVLPGLRNCAITELRVTSGEVALVSYNVPTP
ncbi:MULTISPECIES: histidine phosphatase family protein [unclassified Streptomyces]|uniref:histidine phosphatase family protein n=1 Tax=unclassified Streptomyces TaxID=2593676 RepID=UPI00081E2209|nr:MULTISPECIES: histidine phosphatase family protein [unclassified Streptomyces]SCF84936.1 probable phosphoglycerate mutase [Streptomyces sp. MnatMP-M17]